MGISQPHLKAFEQTCGKQNSRREQKLRFASLSFPFPIPPQVRSSQTPTSFLLHLKKLRHFNLSMVHWLPGLLHLSLSLAELDWWRIHTPRSLAARVSHLAQGRDHLWREAPSSPAWLPCHVNYRKGLKWGSGFSPGKLACSNPLPRPRERAGLWDSGAVGAEMTDSLWLRALQLPLQSLLLSRVPCFLVTSQSGLCPGAKCWSLPVPEAKKDMVCGVHSVPQDSPEQAVLSWALGLPKVLPFTRKYLIPWGKHCSQRGKLVNWAPWKAASWDKITQLALPEKSNFEPVSQAPFSAFRTVLPFTGNALCKFQRGQTKTNYWAGLWEILTLTKDSTLQERQGLESKLWGSILVGPGRKVLL